MRGEWVDDSLAFRANIGLAAKDIDEDDVEDRRRAPRAAN